MSTVTSGGWQRLRIVMETLAKTPEGIAAGEAWKRALAVMPLGSGDDEARERKVFQFQSIALVKAGWLHKDSSRWVWVITEAGRESLLSFPDLEEWRNESTRLYREWELERATQGQRAWLVRPRTGGADLVKRWFDEGFCSLQATHLGDLQAGVTKSVVRDAVEAGYQHVDYAQRVELTNEYHAFLSRMQPSDIVATVINDCLRAGIVTGDPEFAVDDPQARLRRSVEWTPADPVPLESLPIPLPEELARQGTVVDLTAARDLLVAQLMPDRLDEDDLPRMEADAVVPSGPPKLKDATAELASRVHIEQAWLQELIDLLSDRQQVILYGPPGTGKTFLALRLARHLAESEAVRLVQFHPSYAYEDFFEGYRPVSVDGGSVGFALTPGPFRQLASEARANSGQPYMLVIDEINRANLAKVFGELYFLLEYRRETVRLQYSPNDAFTLPPNVFVIGTMNTADRSIALVDAAVRRRFAFVELHPDEQPVRDVLAKWLDATGRAADERAVLLAALNEAIGEEDRDFKIGPSYLMKPDAERDGGLERVWRYSILPLLEEHYYGRLSRAQITAQFGLAAVRKRAANTSASDTGTS